MVSRKKLRGRGRPRAATNAFGQWIDRAGLTREAVAAQLGLTKSALNYLCNGMRLPGLKIAFDIERLTKGEITAKSWLMVTPPPQRSTKPRRKK